MPREFRRADRVAEQLRRELAVLLREEVRDPRVAMVTINSVELSRDLAHAKVFVSAYGADRELDETLDGLRHAAGFLRGELGRRMRIRTVPQLHFHADHSMEDGARISELLERAKKGPSGRE